MNEKHLDSKLALITGGSKGLGRAAALAFAREGAAVTVLARSADVLAAAARSIAAETGAAGPETERGDDLVMASGIRQP